MRSDRFSCRVSKAMWASLLRAGSQSAAALLLYATLAHMVKEPRAIHPIQGDASDCPLGERQTDTGGRRSVCRTLRHQP